MKLSPLNKFRLYFITNFFWYMLFIMPVLLNDVTPFILLIPVLFHLRIEHINHLEKHCYASSTTYQQHNPTFTFTEKDTSIDFKKHTFDENQVKGSAIVAEDKGSAKDIDYTSDQFDETSKTTPTRHHAVQAGAEDTAYIFKRTTGQTTCVTVHDETSVPDKRSRRLNVRCTCSDRTV